MKAMNAMKTTGAMKAMRDRQEIYNKVVEILAEEFELDSGTISLDVNLYQDLGLDSIDAVDLIVKIQELVGKKVDPETFKKVRTVEDVVNAIEKLLER